MTLKDAIMRLEQQIELNEKLALPFMTEKDWQEVEEFHDALRTGIAAARDMLALGRARKLATDGPWFKEPVKGYCIDNILTKSKQNIDNKMGPHGAFIATVEYASGHKVQKFSYDADFIVAAANLAQKWGKNDSDKSDD